METLKVKTPEGTYPIFIGADILTPHTAFARSSFLTQVLGQTEQVCALITNPTVARLHAARVVEALRAHGFAPRVFEIPDGEQFKNLATVSAVYDQLIDARLERNAILFALGGGVVGDLAGFVAATYLRGVPFVQLPTTLLAMVDSSVGGKVAVDHPRGKNLIGAFKQPRAVIADTHTLTTLPATEWRAGMAEAIKHGIIGDPELFAQLEHGNGRLTIDAWLPRAIRVKVDVVQRDPFEQGERTKLNLGHTFGHALEKLSQFSLRHGDAVAIGVVCAARLATQLQVCDAALAARIENVLRALELPVRVPRDMPADAILEAMQSDKKRVGARVRFVLPRALGEACIVDDVPREMVIRVIEELRVQV